MRRSSKSDGIILHPVPGDEAAVGYRPTRSLVELIAPYGYSGNAPGAILRQSPAKVATVHRHGSPPQFTGAD